MTGCRDCEENAAMRAALAATPAALAGQVRARVLREAAAAYDKAAFLPTTTTTTGDWLWLRALADEAEKQ